MIPCNWVAVSFLVYNNISIHITLQ